MGELWSHKQCFILIMTHLVPFQFIQKIPQSLNHFFHCIKHRTHLRCTKSSDERLSSVLPQPVGAGRFRVWEINNSFSGWTCLLWLHFPSFLREGGREHGLDFADAETQSKPTKRKNAAGWIVCFTSLHDTINVHLTSELRALKSMLELLVAPERFLRRASGEIKTWSSAQQIVTRESFFAVMYVTLPK